jgi:hypothetical protein
MNPESNPDLQSRFAALRKADREQAPAWNPRQIEAPIQPPRHALSNWLTMTTAAAACLILSVTLFHQEREPNLVTALPALFDSPSEPLFASLDDSPSSPSNFLLPAYLTLQLP